MYKVKIHENVLLFFRENKIKSSVLKPYVVRLKKTPFIYEEVKDSRYNARKFSVGNLTFAYIVDNYTVYIVDVRFTKSSVLLKIK